ncbi:MAG TPA: hypothetical protein VMV62_02815, partial [Candidatus Paceibacterota bacterium]|nr:hypothetical protein [Candidatus Paceibacterota bacterium]
ETLHNEAWDQAKAENAERDAAMENTERAASEQAEAAKLLEQMRAKAGPSIEQSAVPTQAHGAQETVPAEVTIGADELRQIDTRAPLNGWGVPHMGLEMPRKALKESSGGLLRFDEMRGVVSGEGGRELSRQKAEVAIQNLERSERERGHDAFEYVASPDIKEKLEVGNGQAFMSAFSLKQHHNENVRDNIALGASAAGLGTAVAGMGLAAFGSSLAGLVLMGVIPVAAVGFGGLGVKYLYDKYKERKAVKDYSTASIAKGARSKLSGFLGRKQG